MPRTTAGTGTIAAGPSPMYRLLLVLLSAAATCAPALAGPQHRSPRFQGPLSRLLSAGPIPPNGTLNLSGPTARPLELDDLAPLRLRLTIPF